MLLPRPRHTATPRAPHLPTRARQQNGCGKPELTELLLTSNRRHTPPSKIAEQAERYDEMVEAMEFVSRNKSNGLSVEERNLLSVAFKNVVGAKRASWRILSALEMRHDAKGESNNATMCKDYRKKVEVELKTTCDALLALLEESLLNQDGIETEATVFYLKMKGDYYRYIAE